MAQAQIALENRRAPSTLWPQVAAFLTSLRERREQKRSVARMLGQMEVGRATGARV